MNEKVFDRVELGFNRLKFKNFKTIATRKSNIFVRYKNLHM